MPCVGCQWPRPRPTTRRPRPSRLCDCINPFKCPGIGTEETLMPCVVMGDLGSAMLNVIMLALTRNKLLVVTGASPDMLVGFGIGTF